MYADISNQGLLRLWITFSKTQPVNKKNADERLSSLIYFAVTVAFKENLERPMFHLFLISI